VKHSRVEANALRDFPARAKTLGAAGPSPPPRHARARNGDVVMIRRKLTKRATEEGVTISFTAASAPLASDRTQHSEVSPARREPVERSGASSSHIFKRNQEGLCTSKGCALDARVSRDRRPRRGQLGALAQSGPGSHPSFRATAAAPGGRHTIGLASTAPCPSAAAATAAAR
jgi:hypothetical protein